MDCFGKDGCCSQACHHCCPCLFDKGIAYKSPKEAYAAVITPDTPEGAPVMTRSVHLQQPSKSTAQFSPKRMSDVSVITQQPAGSEPTVTTTPPQIRVDDQSPRTPSSSGSSETSHTFMSLLARPSMQEMGIQEPSLQMAVTYYQESQQLCIHSLSYQLQAPSSADKSFDDLNTFLVLQIQPNVPKTFRSKVRHGTETRAVMDEVFVFPDVPGLEVRYKTVTIGIYSLLDTGQQELIGEVNYSLADADLTGTITVVPVNLDLEKEQVGQPPEILVSLGLDEHGQKLHGLVLKARNIHLPSSSGSKDVFVKVIFVQGQKQASKKWQSSGGSSAPSPVFNQKFQFQLPAPLTHLESEQDYLNIILLCRSTESKHGLPLGMVQIGQNVKDSEAKQLWQRVLGAPGQHDARWLHLLPCRVAPSSQRS